ncbi:hypothetical protein C8J56DRAFT_796201 [Mycena floridula]|nr:hypothetical protein C8J56DRAFT_796201 [Mycena floridula]
MQHDIRLRYHEVVEASHHGTVEILSTVWTGRAGRPRTVIDPTWLRWAYAHRSTSGIAHYLGLGRTMVREQLIEHGIAEAGSDPFAEEDSPDQLLDPLGPQLALPTDIPACNGPHTTISDDTLDTLIRALRVHFRRAGVRMLYGYLRTLGYRIQSERIRQSLLRIDPVHRIFDRIRIRRRGYTVPGPNSLWHHDGQHGHSVHNVRIERLWVDVMAQVGHTWSVLLLLLETRHGLNIHNDNHIWLVQHLFLGTINNHLSFFANSWNNHSIQIRRGASRSPINIFGFDMLALGARGYNLQLTDEELEIYGLDWDALQNETILRSQSTNNQDSEAATSWVGHIGPPQHLSEVVVDVPETIVEDIYLDGLDGAVSQFIGFTDDESIISAWITGLNYCRTVYGDRF